MREEWEEREWDQEAEGVERGYGGREGEGAEWERDKGEGEGTEIMDSGRRFLVWFYNIPRIKQEWGG